MSHAEGFEANLTTPILAGLGANLGLPMSTTHVSTGAIAGIAGTDIGRLKRDAIRVFVLAWTVTPATAAVVAALAFLILRISVRQTNAQNWGTGQASLPSQRSVGIHAPGRPGACGADACFWLLLVLQAIFAGAVPA